ncbi:response regulator [Flavobacterium sp. LS2P90]|uniref:Response regulator n=1 Tax=Flavobacterium xylosi TaxID=3230415 RepID=A0ABW6HRJ3_9FLAO
MVGSNILFVDNCKTFIENAVNAFSQIGVQYTLCFAESDTEAWSLLQGDHQLSPLPQIMLIDINAEGINGIDLINKIRNNFELKSILIFVISNINNNENKLAALNLNIAGYMSKPFGNEEIISFFSTLNDYWNSIEFSSENK